MAKIQAVSRSGRAHQTIHDGFTRQTFRIRFKIAGRNWRRTATVQTLEVCLHLPAHRGDDEAFQKPPAATGSCVNPRCLDNCGKSTSTLAGFAVKKVFQLASPKGKNVALVDFLSNTPGPGTKGRGPPGEHRAKAPARMFSSFVFRSEHGQWRSSMGGSHRSDGLRSSTTWGRNEGG